MAHANQERWSKLVDAKLRNQLVTRDNYIFNNRYEGDPKADSTGSITVSEHFPAPERSLMTAARRGFSSVFKNCIGFFPHFKSISAFIVTAAENKVN